MSDEREYVEELSAVRGWRRDERRLHEWRSPSGVKIDILPAGPALVRKGRVLWGDGFEMSLEGMAVARKGCLEIRLTSGTPIRVACAPAVMLLKMVAWLDRPAERERDLEDIAQLLQCHLGELDERRWEGSLWVADVHYDDMSAFALGEDLASIAAEEHRALVQRFLGTLGAVEMARMAQLAGIMGSDPVEVLARRLDAFRRGMSRGEE